MSNPQHLRMTAMNNNKQISFWQFLTDFKIEIPIIQRDYAQGRRGKEDLRRRFLTQLHESLLKAKPITLDFVYGSKENGVFAPLDGQQRLTTLWLLHWYLALKSGHLKEHAETLARFGYKTRKTSREFFEKMAHCMDEVKNLIEDGERVGDFIRRQNWYRYTYNQDPTIQAAIRMLSHIGETNRKDSIQDFFSDNEESLWKLLIGDSCPITFYYQLLDHDNLPLGDDLYIKMNARGKQLTEFENFKAEFFAYKKDGAPLFDVMNDYKDKEFIKKFENAWTNVFWKKEGVGKDYFDVSYMRFINRVASNYYIAVTTDTVAADKMEKDEFFILTQEKKEENTSTRHAFTDIVDYEPVLKPEFKKFFMAVMDGVCNTAKNYPGIDINKIFSLRTNENENTAALPEKFEIIPTQKGEKITQINSILFYAAMLFLEKNGSINTANKDKYADWMCFAYNVSHNPEVDTVGAYVGVVRLLKKYKDNSNDIVAHLSTLIPKTIQGAAKEQVAEEIVKATHILSQPGMKADIRRAERYSFFKGSIRFLFRDANGKEDWTHYVQKWENAQKFFPPKSSPVLPIHLRNLVSRMNWMELQKIVYDSKEESWKAILQNKNLCKPVNEFLLEGIVSNGFLNDTPSPLKGEPKKVHEALYQTQLLAKEKIKAHKFQLQDTFYGVEHPVLKYNHARENGRYFLGHKRNEILAKLMDDGKISIEKGLRINGTALFVGDNIPFTYNGKDYEWRVENENLPVVIL